jgi:chloride channel protein, CIC family
MLATVLATLVASAIMLDSIMTEKLSRRGLRVPSEYHADMLSTSMAAVMTRDVDTVHISASIGDVAQRFQSNGHSALPVVDDEGRCIGIIGRGDLLREGDWTDDSRVGDAAATDLVSINSTDSVSDALEKMVEERVEHLPVIDGDRLVGMCTRTDIMRARRTHRSHEQLEPGWRPHRWPRRRSGESPRDD